MKDERNVRMMDEDLRKKLHGLAPFSIKSTTKYTPPIYGEDIPEEFRPIFYIRPYSRAEIKSAKKVLAEISKSEEKIASMTAEESEALEESIYELARKVVMNWDRFYDAGSGSMIPYESDINGGVDKELFYLIPSTIVGMILAEAVKISGMIDISKLGLK